MYIDSFPESKRIKKGFPRLCTFNISYFLNKSIALNKKELPSTQARKGATEVNVSGSSYQKNASDYSQSHKTTKKTLTSEAQLKT